MGYDWPKRICFGDLAEKFSDPLGVGSRLSLIFAIGAELGCSILLILGLRTRFVVIPLAFTMAVALFRVHAVDPWLKNELGAVYLIVYTTLICAAGGKFSLDHLMLAKRAPSKR